jgi:hypothetical protein
LKYGAAAAAVPGIFVVIVADSLLAALVGIMQLKQCQR